jgi:hypothetical protein
LQDFFAHGAMARNFNRLRLKTAPTQRWPRPAVPKTIPTLLKKRQIQTYSNQEDCRKGQAPSAHRRSSKAKLKQNEDKNTEGKSA